MSNDPGTKLHYINGRQVSDSGYNEPQVCKYDPTVGNHLENIAGTLERLEKCVETNVGSLATLASGRNQIGAGFFFAIVGCLFFLLVIMFLYFTNQQAIFNKGSFEVHPNVQQNQEGR